MRRLLLALPVLGILVCPGQVDAAPIILFEAKDIQDSTEGQDLWEYLYYVSGHDFLENQGFSVLFDVGLYANLTATSLHEGWDIIAFPVQDQLPDFGDYNALAVIASAPTDRPFSVSFTWLGGSQLVPGIQPVLLNQYEFIDGLFTVASGFPEAVGNTAPLSGSLPVPEPGTLLLVTLGAGLVLRKRHRRAH